MSFIYPKVNFRENSDIEKYFAETAHKYFDLEELLSESIISNYGQKGLQFMDIKCLQTLVGIREWFKYPVFVNNWKYLKDNKIKNQVVFDSRICRFPDDESYTEGSEHSVKIGSNGLIVKKSRAIDYDVKGFTAAEVRTVIKANKNTKPFDIIMRIELSNWNHNDFKPIANRIVEFGK